MREQRLGCHRSIVIGVDLDGAGKKDCGLLSRSSPISEASRVSRAPAAAAPAAAAPAPQVPTAGGAEFFSTSAPSAPSLRTPPLLLLCGVDRQDCLSKVPTSLL